MKSNFFEGLFRELKVLYNPLIGIKGDPSQIFAFYKSIGYDLEGILGAKANQVVTDIDAIITAIEEAIAKWDDLSELRKEIWQMELPEMPGSLEEVEVWVNGIKENETVTNIISFVDDVKPKFEAAWKALQNLKKNKDNLTAALNTPEIRSALELLPQRTLDALVIAYCERRLAILIPIFKFTTVLKEFGPDEKQEIKHPTSGDIVIVKNAVPEFHWNQLVQLVKDPENVFNQEYFPPGAFADQNAVNQTALKFFGRIKAILEVLNLQTLLGLQQPSNADPLPAGYGQRLPGMLTAFYPFFSSSKNTDTEIGATIGMLIESPHADNGPGVFVLPFGELGFSTRLGNWDFASSAELDPQGFKITKDGIVAFDAGNGNQAKADFSLNVRPESVRKWVLGAPTGTRLELSPPDFSGSFDAKGNDVELRFKVGWEDNFIFLQQTQDDGFLKKVMPKDGVSFPFNIGIEWSNKNGFHFTGRAGFEVSYVFKEKEDSVFKIQQIKLKLDLDQESLALSGRVDAKLHLGPFLAVVTGVGTGLEWTFPKGDDSGKLNFQFLKPTGIGLAVTNDSLPVRGGGELTREGNRYTGILQLSFQNKINFSAIGVLDTKLPNGDGYSLLLLIAVDGFAPIALGFGFFLTGIGGLLALHRRMDTEVLRSGIHDKTLDSFLFPSNPIADAAAIIADLDRAMPIAEKHFVFGPTAKIIWGAGKAVLQVKLGLFIHITDQRGVVVAIPGVVSTLLPDETNETLRIRANFLLVIRFTEGDAALDATLFDSRIAKFTMAGDLIVRIAWKEQPTFVVSAGGFNPRFKPPSSLPSMKRIQIVFLNDNSAKVSLQCYFALTPNTVQTGARLDASFKAGDFQVVGWLSFDVLFQFKPFKVFIDFSATFAVKSGGKDLLAVTLEMSLEGPDPWHLQGYASFTIVCVEINLKVDKTFGGTGRVEQPLEDVKILDWLKVEFSKADNWQVLPPAVKGNHIRLRPSAPTQKFLPPDGGIKIRQSAIPLKTVIQKVGNAKPDIQAPWQISEVAAGSHQLPVTTDVLEFFPPSHFLNLTDSERFSRSSFEQFPCGVEAVSNEEFQRGSDVADAPSKWEKITIYGAERNVVLGNVSIPQSRLNSLAKGGAAAQSRSHWLRQKISPRRKNMLFIKKTMEHV